jgi:hypothetical protein
VPTGRIRADGFIDCLSHIGHPTLVDLVSTSSFSLNLRRASGQRGDGAATIKRVAT